MKKILLLASLLLYAFVMNAQVITDTGTLRTRINAQIVANGTKSISALKMNQILNGFLNSWPASSTSSVVTVKVSLSSAEILALNTTPKQLVAAPGAGKVLRPISFVTRLNYGTTTYATNVVAQLRYNGTTTVIANNTAVGNTESVIAEQLCSTSVSYTPASSDPVNKSLELTVQTGNPTTGNGTLDVYITYTVITL